jgi:hypothetical protein
MLHVHVHVIYMLHMHETLMKAGHIHVQYRSTVLTVSIYDGDYGVLLCEGDGPQ